MIFTIRDMPKQKLFNEMALFAELPYRYKRYLFFVANKNLLYGCSSSCCVLRDEGNCPDLRSISEPFKLKEYLQDKKGYQVNGWKIKTWYELERLYETITSEKNKILGGLLFNSILFDSGLCPLVLYAFNRFLILSKTPTPLSYLIELSLVYLYRLVPNKEKCLPKGFCDKIDCGETSYIYVNQESRVVCKYPKTLASKRYLQMQEAINISILKKTKLNRYCLGSYRYDEQSKCLFHEYIDGVNGEFLLMNNNDLSSRQRDVLKEFFLEYNKREEKGLLLDIHPGNFIWDRKEGIWKLIDCGSIPIIGSDYYEFSTFEEYFGAIWLSRFENMKKIPIRSLDLKDDFVIRKNCHNKIVSYPKQTCCGFYLNDL